MRDFKSIIGGTNDEVKNIRVSNAAASIKDQSEMLIQQMKMDYRAKQNSIEEMLDLAPSNSVDLATNLKNVNASDLLGKLYKTADEMSVLARKIQIRAKIHNILFPEDKNQSVKPLTKEELDFLNGLI